MALSGCTVVPRQSGLSSTAENVAASNNEIRTQLYGNAYAFSSAVQQASDAVLADALEPEIRRNALEFKIDAISASQITTAFSDPLMGLLDLWALSVQLKNYYTTGDGRDDFVRSFEALRRPAHSMSPPTTIGTDKPKGR